MESGDWASDPYQVQRFHAFLKLVEDFSQTIDPSILFTHDARVIMMKKASAPELGLSSSEYQTIALSIHEQLHQWHKEGPSGLASRLSAILEEGATDRQTRLLLSISARADSRGRFDAIDTKINGLDATVRQLSQDMQGLKTEVSGLRTEVIGLQIEVSAQRSDEPPS